MQSGSVRNTANTDRALRHSPRVHTTRLQAGAMHIKPVRAREQDTMPAMQMGGLQKYPTLQGMSDQKKKMASGTNEHVHSSALKEINHCCWDEREMSGVIVKTKKKAGVPWISVKSDWWGLFLWMLMSQVTHSSSFQSYLKGGEEHTRYTNSLYMGIIHLRAIENSGYYGPKSLILNLFVDCNRWWCFCIPSGKVSDSDMSFQTSVQSNPQQRLAKPLCGSCPFIVCWTGLQCPHRINPRDAFATLVSISHTS